MALGTYFTGTPARLQQFSTVTPQQANLKGAASNQALNMLQNLGASQFNFEPIEQQALTNFNTKTIPGLAERFTAMGPGAQRGSAFQSQLAQAGAGLEEGLAALKSQFGLQQQGLNQQLLHTLLSAGLEPETANGIEDAQPGFLEHALNEYGPTAVRAIGNAFKEYGPSVLSSIGSALGSFFGPAGTAAGGTAGTVAGHGINALLDYFSSKPKPFESPQARGVDLPDYGSLIQKQIGYQAPQKNIYGQKNQQANLPNYNQLINSSMGVR